MAAEASAFLVKEKLRSLVDGGGIVFPRLEGKINDAIGKLENMSERSGEQSPHPQLLTSMLTSMLGLEDAIDAYLIKRTRPRKRHGDPAISNFHFLPPLWSQMQLRQAIKKFLKEVRNVRASASASASASLTDDDSRGPPPTTASYDNWLTGDRARPKWEDRVFRYQHDDDIGRKEDVEEVVSFLINRQQEEEEDLLVLPVVGSRGQGKTEVVRSAYDNIKVKRHFQFRAWVYLDSQNSDFRHILVELIHQGTMSRSTDLDHMEEAALQDMLFKMLMEKTYLIVFINVCNRDTWTQLAVPLPDCHNGSRVVLTTPKLDVANFVDPMNPPFKLKPLTCDESWLLLLKHSDKHDQPPTFDHLKEIVMQKCKSMSMAITLLGGVLYNKQLSEWEQVLNGYVVDDMDDEVVVVSNMLAFSFHALHPVLKGCLIYMILFPEELEIPVRRLLRLWLAEGFLNTQKTLPEDAAEICLEELINRKLIEVTNWKLDGSPKTCRMPHLIRNLLQDNKSVPPAGLYDIYRESGPQSGTTTESQKLKSRRIAEYSSHGRNTNTSNNSSVLDQTNKHLHSYLSFNTHIRGTANTEIGNFLKVLIRKTGFALLRVLDLEGVYKPKLPNTIGTLVLLKFLGLRLTVLDSIPESVSTLPLLETLDLKHTNVSIIPSSIWKSKSLRHLYVNEVRLDGSIQKTSDGLLTNFQSIRGLYIVDKRVVSNVLERFVNLRKVGITCHDDSIDQVTTWISKLSHLETLKLRSLDRLGKPSRLAIGLELKMTKMLKKLYLLGKLENPGDLVNSLPSCLRKLTLSSSHINENDFMKLGNLPELVILRLLANSYTNSCMTFSSGKFPKLRGLKLWMLPELEVWKVENGAMPYLEELEIRKCNKIKALDGLEHLTRLNQLVLTNMPGNLVQNVRESSEASKIYVKENTWKFSYYQDETSSDKTSSSSTTNSGSGEH